MTNEQEHDAHLEQVARRLGAQAADRLDVERTAAAVIARLRTESAATRPWWIRPGWLRAAAAVVLILGGGLMVRSRMGRPPAQVAHYVRDELQDLSTDQLRELLDSLDQTLTDATLEPSNADMRDLTTKQLQALLQSLEG
ncbi:MAG: hypothetical protein ACREMF_02380 [Gemmatimonadales bacterium]